MINPLKIIKHKINDLLATFIVVGVLLVVLAILIACFDALFRLLVAIALITAAYGSFFVAYKMHKMKKLF